MLAQLPTAQRLSTTTDDAGYEAVSHFDVKDTRGRKRVSTER